MRSTADMIEKKAAFEQLSSFSIFKDSLRAFFFGLDYSKCFNQLKQSGVTPLDAAEAFSAIVAYHPSEAFRVFGKESSLSYATCINSFKDFDVDYKNFFEREVM